MEVIDTDARLEERWWAFKEAAALFELDEIDEINVRAEFIIAIVNAQADAGHRAFDIARGALARTA